MESIMVTTVPSLEGQLYLKDPLSIIAYTLRRYQRTPKDTVNLLPDLIISLPWQIAQLGKEPDALTRNIQADLQGVFDRIFANERRIEVAVSHTVNDATSYNISVAITYTAIDGEPKQVGMMIPLKDGRPVIPEDSLNWTNGPVPMQ
jgi:hypothetical protein